MEVTVYIKIHNNTPSSPLIVQRRLFLVVHFTQTYSLHSLLSHGRKTSPAQHVYSQNYYFFCQLTVRHHFIEIPTRWDHMRGERWGIRDQICSTLSQWSCKTVWSQLLRKRVKATDSTIQRKRETSQWLHCSMVPWKEMFQEEIE